MDLWSDYGRNNFYSDEEYYINDCGIQTFGKDTMISVVRENGRFDYHILLIKSGNCSFEYENKMRILEENNMVIYYPNEPQKYYWGGSYSESYWLHFSGTKIPDLLRKCNIRNGVFRCDNSSKIFEMFDKLIKTYNSNIEPSNLQSQSNINSCTNIKTLSLFVTLLCEISENINHFTPEPTIVTQVLDFMHSHYNEKISFHDFAKSKGIGTARLVQLFQQKTHLTPNKYQKMLQIEKAERLLISSNMNITEIAQKVGFDDPLYFSRAFKNHTSYSPTDYRKFYNNNKIK